LADLPKLPELRFDYRVVETALGSIYRATDDDVRRSELRARINYFQRAQVLGAEVRVGKGQRVEYSVGQVERWLCCFELAELGVSPTTVGKLVASLWDKKFARIIRAAQNTTDHAPGPDDIAICVGGVHLMSGNWSPGSGFPGVPSIDHCTLRQLPGRVMGWMQMTAGDRQAPRLLIVNLSERLRQFHTALADAYMDHLRPEHAAGKAEAQGRTAGRRKRAK